MLNEWVQGYSQRYFFSKGSRSLETIVFPPVRATPPVSLSEKEVGAEDRIHSTPAGRYLRIFLTCSVLSKLPVLQQYDELQAPPPLSPPAHHHHQDILNQIPGPCEYVTLFGKNKINK